MGTPYHLQSSRIIMTKILNMKQQPPALPPPPPAPSKIILKPRHRTSPAMWCAAIVCFAFSILVIVAGVVILIVFLAVKPRAPSFDTANASLNSVYVDSPAYFNGDMTLVANISNPNQKIDVVFRSATVELLFRDRPMAAQALPPFMQRRGQSRVLNVHMVSSRVLLPPDVAVELVNQVRSNRVVYTIRGAFKVEARFWFGHYTYWMYTVCELELSAPPCGVLVGVMWIRGCCFLSLVWSVAAGAWRLPAKKSRKIVRNQNTEFKQYSIQFLQTDDTGSTKGSESLHTSDPEMHHSILELPS